MSFVNKPLTDIMDCVRASTATYVDPTGRIRTAGVNEPRIDFSGDQGRLLVEEARTNLLTWSEDFNNSVWTKTDVTFSGEVCTPSSTSGSKWFAQITGTTAGLAYTKTVVAKAKELSFIQIASSTGFTPSAANFDLTLGVLGNVSSGVVARIKPLSDGYFECSATFISDNTSASGRLLVALVPTAASGRLANMSTNGTDSLIIKLTQLEQASTPSSYIPTQASAVTRAADNVSRVLGDEFNKSEWTVFVDFDFKYGTGGISHIFSLSTSGSSSSAPRSSIRVNSFSGNWAWQIQSDDSSTLLNTGAGLPNFNGGRNKLCYSYKNDTAVIALNGQAVALTPAFTDKTFNDLTRFWVTSNSPTSNYSVIDTRIYPKYLPESECIQLTKV